MTESAEWNTIYLTDKSGQKVFRTTASPCGTMSEIRNITRRIPHCKFIDQASAVIMLNGVPYDSETGPDLSLPMASDVNMTDDELLAELLG